MRNLIKFSIFITSLLLLQACAPSSYIVDEPEPSTASYTDQRSSTTNLTFTDNRDENEKVFSYGVLKADLIINGSPIDPIKFLERHTAKELTSRGITTNVGTAGDILINVNKLEIRNHRTNGFTPFISLTMLSADAMFDGKQERIAAYIKRGKVPVWSFDEIVEPTLNEPLNLVVKEFSAKLSRKLYGAKISNTEVDSLISKINNNPDNPTTYMDVYQLGFGNNSSAIPALVDYTNSQSEYIRLAAISSLGILKAEEQIGLLKGIYSHAGTWSDRAMALKAIGDIGTPEALSFLKDAKLQLAGKGNKEELWTKEIINLYL